MVPWLHPTWHPISFSFSGSFPSVLSINITDTSFRKPLWPSIWKSLYKCSSSTTDKFRLRWNNYKENNQKAKRGEEHMQPLVFEHFSSNDQNGFLEDCSITLTDKTYGSDPNRREEYWRRVLKTVTPFGLNTIDWLFYLGKLHW